jgi:hypothetical protein
MIDYIDIKKLGFKRKCFKDSVYENQFGREYWWMEYEAKTTFIAGSNTILFNWDCDKREIKVYVNENIYCIFNDWEPFINFFRLFSIKEPEQEYNFA